MRFVENDKAKSMTTLLTAPDQVVVLTDVQWETYERLIADQEDRRGPRLCYDCGTLEIMSPSHQHENLKNSR